MVEQMSSILDDRRYNVPMSTERVPFGDWLRDELEKAGLEKSDFARKIGVPPATVSRWVNNSRRPESEYCQVIADALEIDANVVRYMARRQPDLPRPLDEFEQDRKLERLERQLHEVRKGGLSLYVKVTSYGSVPASTFNWRAAVEGEHKVDVPRGYVRGRALSDLFVIQASGDCLQALGIKDTDLVLCRKIRTGPPQHGDIVVARLGDEVTLKEYRRDGDWVELRDGDGNLIYRESIMNADELDIVGVKLYRWEPGPDWEGVR